MGRPKGKLYEVKCNLCGKSKLIHPCKFHHNKVFYCSVSHQILYRNKFNNPSKREDVKLKIGKSSKERGAIWIALNSENYKNRKIKRGREHPNWKENVSYKGLHQWLTKTYGKPIECDNQNCLKKSNLYDWALLRGKKYEKKRENFVILCKSCHNTYDRIIFNIKTMKNKFINLVKPQCVVSFPLAIAE